MTLTTTWQGIVLPWLIAFALVFLPIAGGLLGKAVHTELKRRNMNEEWWAAIERAAGAGYAFLLASGQPITSKAALAAAAKVGADYLQARVPGIIVAKALDPAAVAEIAGAQLGKLLAVDPSVGPATAPADPQTETGFSAAAARTLG